jgi:hypothetical protein
MTLEDLKKQLETTGFPVAYNVFNTEQTMPFICFLVAYSNNFAADDIVYKKIDHIQVELYTSLKDTDAEDKVEKALSSFIWYKTESYDDTEKQYQVIYEIEV